MSFTKKPFTFHTGFDLNINGNQAVTDCPFCGKEGHFYYNEEYLWDCKVCSESGNLYTFIRLLHEKVCRYDYEHLNKGLPRRVLENNHVKYNPLNHTYVLPVYKNDQMINLKKWNPLSNEMRGTPSLSAPIYHWQEITEDTIWLCEGEWDKLAAEAIIGISNPITAIGVPGAGTFKREWAQLFRDKDLYILYDNDTAGQKGINRVIDILKDSPQKPRSLHYLDWPEELPEGYDLRDFYLEHGRKSFKMISDLLVPHTDKSAVKVTRDVIEEDFSCDSYDKVIDAFRTAFHTTDDMCAALALTLASIWSVKLDGAEQLWLKIIGPPGGGKTRIAQAVSACDQVVLRSTFTGLFSGWNDDKSEDPGMIPLISGRTLIVKDADALLKQPNIEQILSQLRDFYDKNSSVTFRNRRQYDYRDVKSTFIICGTHVLRSADHSFLGERFLSIELDVTEEDVDIITRKVMDRTINVVNKKIKDPETYIMSAMKGYVNHIMDRTLDSEIPKDMQEIILDLAKLTALMRTEVHRDFRGEIKSTPMSELPTRIIGQTVVATLALCVVLGKSVADNEIFKIVNKLLRDTINPKSNRFKICQLLLHHNDLDAFELMELTGLTRNRLTQEIEDLVTLRMLEKFSKPSPVGQPGRKRHAFKLIDSFKNLILELR